MNCPKAICELIGHGEKVDFWLYLLWSAVEKLKLIVIFSFNKETTNHPVTGPVELVISPLYKYA